MERYPQWLCCIKNSSVNELAKSAGIMSPSQL
jgi:hypothetical protein